MIIKFRTRHLKAQRNFNLSHFDLQTQGVDR